MKELQNLNNIDEPLIDAPIEQIIKDPRKYALDYMEKVFIANQNKFNESYELGKQYALNVKGLKEQDGNMYYPDEEPVDKNLPESYSLGNTLDAPNQICHNCKHYADDYCIKWDAEIRDEYWCRSWQKEE